jgi:hypothetical protein
MDDTELFLARDEQRTTMAADLRPRGDQLRAYTEFLDRSDDDARCAVIGDCHFLDSALQLMADSDGANTILSRPSQA